LLLYLHIGRDVTVAPVRRAEQAKMAAVLVTVDAPDQRRYQLPPHLSAVNLADATMPR
jgi:hypothetical protein